MKELRYFIALTVLACFIASLTCTASAEEGMWTLDNLPLKQLKNKYHFTPEAECD